MERSNKQCKLEEFDTEPFPPCPSQRWEERDQRVRGSVSCSGLYEMQRNESQLNTFVVMSLGPSLLLLLNQRKPS